MVCFLKAGLLGFSAPSDSSAGFPGTPMGDGAAGATGAGADEADGAAGADGAAEAAAGGPNFGSGTRDLPRNTCGRIVGVKGAASTGVAALASDTLLCALLWGLDSLSFEEEAPPPATILWGLGSLSFEEEAAPGVLSLLFEDAVPGLLSLLCFRFDLLGCLLAAATGGVAASSPPEADFGA